MGRREEKKLEKRERLEAEGLRLFTEQGYDRASIEQVAAAADVARGTFYLYFPDKLTLFETLTDRWFEGVLTKLAEADVRIDRAGSAAELRQIYDELGLALALIGLAHADAVLLSLRELRRPGEAGEALRRRERALLAAIVGITERARTNGLIHVEDPALAALIIYGAVEKLLYTFLSGEDIGPPDRAAAGLVALFSRALGLG